MFSVATGESGLFPFKIQWLNDQIISLYHGCICICINRICIWYQIIFCTNISFHFLFFIFLPKIVFQFRIKLYLYHIVFVFCCHLSDSPIVQRILMSFQLCCSPHPQCFTLRCNVFQSKCNVLRSKCNPMQYHP